MTKRIVLYSTSTFSDTGGIQKMTRTLARVLYRLSQKNDWDVKLHSVYDADGDVMEQYLPAGNFKGHQQNKVAFTLNAIATARKQDLVILSHINLALAGLLIKMINPACELWLIAHGIDVWRPLSWVQRLFLQRSARIICVSNFTLQQMVERHGVEPSKCVVVNNMVDPFMKLPAHFVKPERLLKQYGLGLDSPVVFTLTRLASTEMYKGHDMVIRAIGRLKKKFPGIRYVLGGKYDQQEELRIRRLIQENEVDNEVILTGFIPEDELPDYFLLADLFVLPSKKEGFGIVFIEALACGLPVICGDADGSMDAIRHGELGTAVNPDDLEQLEIAMAQQLASSVSEDKRMYLQQQCLLYFGENEYMGHLEKLILNGTAS